MIFLFNCMIFRFHINYQGCKRSHSLDQPPQPRSGLICDERLHPGAWGGKSKIQPVIQDHTPPKTNQCPLKNDGTGRFRSSLFKMVPEIGGVAPGWNTSFLLGCPIFRVYRCIWGFLPIGKVYEMQTGHLPPIGMKTKKLFKPKPLPFLSPPPSFAPLGHFFAATNTKRSTAEHWSATAQTRWQNGDAVAAAVSTALMEGNGGSPEVLPFGCIPQSDPKNQI